MMPLAFTDSQWEAVQNASRPLSPFQRSAFVAALGHMFYGRAEIGDRELHRALRELQHEHLSPPTRTHPRSPVIWKK
jgi:hypothetical protein